MAFDPKQATMPMAQLQAALEKARTDDPGRLFVTLAYAQSLDGSIALARGQPCELSGPRSLELTHRLRAMHDGILIGIDTLLADDPRLDVRLTPGRDPIPVVVDSRLRIPGDAALLHNGRRPWIATTEASSLERRELLAEQGMDVLVLPALPNGWVDLGSLCAALVVRGVGSLMVEGGARIITSFLAARLADHLLLTLSPTLLGGLAAVSRVHPLSPFVLPALGPWRSREVGCDLVVGAPLRWPKP